MIDKVPRLGSDFSEMMKHKYSTKVKLNKKKDSGKFEKHLKNELRKLMDND